jgi:sugar phosphate isomerase/epimerase
MDVGAVTRSFTQLTNEETARLLAENGFRWTELCFSQTDSSYWVYNGRRDLSDMTDERSRAIVQTYRRRGVEVPALGVFTNLIEPNDAELDLNFAYFERMMQIASVNAIPCVATECGFIPGRRGIHAETYEETFQRLLESFRRLARLADRYHVDVALEPCVLDIVPSAKRTADFIAQVGSARIKVLLDPANLIANSSEEDMFRHLAPHVAYFHGKDRKVNDRGGRVVGDGDIDWPLFLGLYHRHAEGVPFILEYVDIRNFREIRDRVLRSDAAARRFPAQDARAQSGTRTQGGTER